jgi:hypothetical protein
MISRRAFLMRLSMLGGGVGWTLHAPLQALAAVGQRRRTLRLERVTRSVFAELVGSTFHVYSALGTREDMTLVEAAVLRFPTGRRIGTKRANGRKAFSLVFQGSTDQRLPQQTYRIEHRRLGSFPLFLVPVGPLREDGQQYQAILS